MNKQESILKIEERLYMKFKKDFINVSEFAEYLTIGRNRAREILYKTRFIPNGKEKLYFIGEIAITIESITAKAGWYEFRTWKN